MNAFFEILIIALVVGLAALFVVLRIIKALRGGKPACCSDTGEFSPQPGSSSCADSIAKGPDGGLAPRPSYCAGCTGCGSPR